MITHEDPSHLENPPPAWLNVHFSQQWCRLLHAGNYLRQSAVGKLMAQLFVAGENLARRHPYWFAVIHVTLLMLVLKFVYHAGFDTNDDSVMNMIVAGQGVGLQPDEHMIFTHVWIGLGLKTLYTHLPMFPWYVSYLYFVHWLANTAILGAMISSRYTRLRLTMFWCYYFVVEGYFFTNLQFTTTAYLACVTGFSYLLLFLMHGWRKDRLWRVGYFTTALIGLLLGNMIRADVFLMILGLALPLLAVQTIFHPRPKWYVLNAIGTLAIIVGVVWGVNRFHTSYYEQDAGWLNFYRYNALRVKFNDEGWVHFKKETESVFKDAQWSINDFHMIYYWFYDDPKIYSIEKLDQILKGYPWVKHLQHNTKMLDFQGIFLDRPSRALIFAWPVLLFYVQRSRGNVLLVLLSMLTALSLISYLLFFRKMPPARVYMPILSFPLLLSLQMAQVGTRLFAQGLPRLELTLFSRKQRSPPIPVLTGMPYKWMAFGLTALMAYAFTIQSYAQYRRGRERIKDEANYFAVLEAMKSSVGERPLDENLFVCWANSFPYECTPLWGNMQELHNVHLLAIGWPQRTPHNERMKAHFGIENLVEAFVQRTDVIHVSQTGFFSLLNNFVKEHYSTTVEGICWFQNPRCVIGRVVKQLPKWDWPTSNENLEELHAWRLNTMLHR